MQPQLKARNENATEHIQQVFSCAKVWGPWGVVAEVHVVLSGSAKPGVELCSVHVQWHFKFFCWSARFDPTCLIRGIRGCFDDNCHALFHVRAISNTVYVPKGAGCFL